MEDKKNRPTRSGSVSKNVPEKKQDEIVPKNPVKNTDLCADCRKLVVDEDDALECQICKRWVHARCQNIDQHVYAFIRDHPNNGINFFCEGCNISAAGMVKIMTALKDRVDKLETDMQEMKKKMKNKVDKNSIKSIVGDSLEDDDLSEKMNDIIESKVDNELAARNLGEINKTQISEAITGSVQEELEKQKRKNNIIIHGMKETHAPEDGDVETEPNDLAKVVKILKITDPELKEGDLGACERIGQPQPGKNRPIIIEIKKAQAKTKIMKNLGNLGGKGLGISIVNDLTHTQREEQKKLVEEAKHREESGDGKYRVVGPPGKMKLIKAKEH